MCSAHYQRAKYQALSPAERTLYNAKRRMKNRHLAPSYNRGYRSNNQPSTVPKPTQEERLQWEVILRESGLGMGEGMDQWRLFYGYEENKHGQFTQYHD